MTPLGPVGEPRRTRIGPGRLSLQATGPVAAAVAWERYAVPALWQTWAPHITGVDYPFERLRPGTQGRVHGPVGVRLPFTIRAVDEPERTWSWTVSLGVTTLTLVHGVAETGRGSRTWLDMSGPLPLLVGYAPLAQLSLHRLVTRS